jgi:hypothetical protein
VRRRRTQLFRRQRRGRLIPLLIAGLSAVGFALFVVFNNRHETQPAAPAVGPLHVHALGVNPSDGALFIATHTGLFRLGPSGTKPERVGDRRQDTMGFTVVGPDRFLGSGHPDLRDKLPPLLGLIESRDSGETWRSISLLGSADFHVLRVRGKQIVGYDSSGGRVMVSDDGGRSWRVHRFAGPLFDVVIAPDQPRMLLATTQVQLVLSRDGGRTWGAVTETTGLLAWPQPDRLYLLAPDGRLWLSPDRGKRWKPLGALGGRPAAFAVVPGGPFYAALHGGLIKTSSDGGSSWRLLALPV